MEYLSENIVDTFIIGKMIVDMAGFIEGLTWYVKRGDGVAGLWLSGFVFWNISVLDFHFPVDHLRLQPVGSLDQLLALSKNTH